MPGSFFGLSISGNIRPIFPDTPLGSLLFLDELAVEPPAAGWVASDVSSPAETAPIFSDLFIVGVTMGVFWKNEAIRLPSFLAAAGAAVFLKNRGMPAGPVISAGANMFAGTGRARLAGHHLEPKWLQTTII